MSIERNLAFGVMESIEHMTGHAPRRKRRFVRFSAWMAVAAFALSLLAAAAR